VADGWCWFVVREKYCWLVAGGWFVLREKYCWLVADKPNEQAVACELKPWHVLEWPTMGPAWATEKKRTADRTRRHPLPSCHEMTPPPPFPLAAAPAPARPRAAPPPSRRFPSHARGVRGRERGRRYCCSRAAVCSDRTTDPLLPSPTLAPPQPSALLVCFCCQ
jgi:hypothetical protein